MRAKLCGLQSIPQVVADMTLEEKLETSWKREGEEALIKEIQRYFSMFANFVYCGSHTRLTVPIGPLRCLAMMISAIPLFSESLL